MSLMALGRNGKVISRAHLDLQENKVFLPMPAHPRDAHTSVYLPHGATHSIEAWLTAHMSLREPDKYTLGTVRRNVSFCSSGCLSAVRLQDWKVTQKILMLNTVSCSTHTVHDLMNLTPLRLSLLPTDLHSSLPALSNPQHRPLSPPRRPPSSPLRFEAAPRDATLQPVAARQKVTQWMELSQSATAGFVSMLWTPVLFFCSHTGYRHRSLFSPFFF